MITAQRAAIVLIAIAAIGFAPSSEAQVDCTTQTGNVILNCGFTTDLTLWAFSWGDSFTWTGADGDGSPGAVSVDAFNTGVDYRAAMNSGACISGPGGFFGAGGAFKVTSGGSGATQCEVNVVWYDNNCATLITASDIGTQIVGSSWTRIGTTGLSSPGVLEPIITLYCTDTVDFTVVFDDAVVADAWVPVELQSFTIE